MIFGEWAYLLAHSQLQRASQSRMRTQRKTAERSTELQDQRLSKLILLLGCTSLLLSGAYVGWEPFFGSFF